MAQGITLTETDNIVSEALLTTSNSAYSKKAGYEMVTADKEDGDLNGPFALAAYARNETTEAEVIWVNCDAEVDQMLLDFPIMETYALLVDGGKRYLLTHGHVYNKENMPKGPYEAMIYGHSHLWELSHNEKGQAIVNTGSITFPKGGNPPTFATLEDGKFTMYQLDTLEVLATMEA